VKYIRFTFRVLIALILFALAFVIGLYLPLSVEDFLHGDPGMSGGAALVFLGFPFGVMGALITGFFSLVKLHPCRELSK
jgi:hypothetical protein